MNKPTTDKSYTDYGHATIDRPRARGSIGRHWSGLVTGKPDPEAGVRRTWSWCCRVGDELVVTRPGAGTKSKRVARMAALSARPRRRAISTPCSLDRRRVRGTDPLLSLVWFLLRFSVAKKVWPTGHWRR